MTFILSALHTIKVDIEAIFKAGESDIARFCKAFEKDFKSVPSALQVTENFISEAAPVITAAVAIADSAAEPEVAAALATAQTALAGLDAAATAAVSGTSVLSSLENFAATVPATLTSLAIKDVALKSKIEWIVKFIVGESKVLVPAVENWVKQLKPTTPVA